MKVKELIEALTLLPPDLPVIVDGYENGFDTPRPPRIVKARLNSRPDAPYYLGKHGDPRSDYVDPRTVSAPVSDAVLLSTEDPDEDEAEAPEVLGNTLGSGPASS